MLCEKDYFMFLTRLISYTASASYLIIINPYSIHFFLNYHNILWSDDDVLNTCFLSVCNLSFLLQLLCLMSSLDGFVAFKECTFLIYLAAAETVKDFTTSLLLCYYVFN